MMKPCKLSKKEMAELILKSNYDDQLQITQVDLDYVPEVILEDGRAEHLKTVSLTIKMTKRVVI